MESKEHRDMILSAVEEYEQKGYSFGNKDVLQLTNMLRNMGWRPDFILSNHEEIVIIEVVKTSDHSRPECIEKIEDQFKKPIRLEKRKIQDKYYNIFIIDEDLWAWAQYKAKTLGKGSVSEYLFELIKLDREKNLIEKA